MVANLSIASTTGTPAQALEPLRGVRLLVTDSIEVAKQGVNWRSWRTYVVLLFLAAVVGDIVTTQYMMSSGMTEEGNPVAAAGMEIVGQTGYVILASLLMTTMLVFVIAKPRHYAGWVAQTMTLLILAVKVEVVWHNVGLWTGAWSGIS